MILLKILWKLTRNKLIRISVASQNPVKLDCTRKAFEALFPQQSIHVTGHKVISEVSEQPMTDEETYRGAWNRAVNLKKINPDSDYWVGIEGGIETIRDTMHAFAWMIVMNDRQHGEARTATFLIPDRLRNLVSQGIELGHADDEVFNRKNSKQKDGAVGILTHGLIDRSRYYEHAICLALIPFINPSLFS